MSTFAIAGRCLAFPPPDGWRDELAQMLGVRPRRIGIWAELGLYGALRCLADAGETRLPQNAQLWLSSQRGPYAAIRQMLDQLREGPVMPLTFLQTQPSQFLALLAAHLKWSGHACFVADARQADLLRLIAAQVGSEGVLAGWVDEDNGGNSVWLRLQPSQTVQGEFRAGLQNDLLLPGVTHLRLSPAGLQVCCESC